MHILRLQSRQLPLLEMTRPLRLFLLLISTLLLLSSNLQPVFGMIDTDQTISCSSDDSFFPAYSFEFAEGGSFSLTLSLDPGNWLANNHTVQVMLATETQLDPIRSASMDDVCATIPFNYAPTLWQVQLGANMPTQSVSMSIPYVQTSDWIRLLVLNCDGDEFDFHYSDVAINPGGEYLSLSEVPYKKLYLSFLWIWSICALLWSFHLYAYRHWNIALQTTLLLLPASKIGLTIPSLLYWRSASTVGIYPFTLSWVVLGTEVGDRVVWFTMIYILACGWRIVKPSIDYIDRRVIFFIISSLSITYTVYSIYQGFFIFLMLIFYIFALRMIFAAIVENGNTLIRQMHILSRHDIDHTLTPLQPKLQQFRYLQVYLVAFISVDVIFHLWAEIFLRNQPWISDMMEHAISVVMCGCLAWSFGLRPFNPYYLQIISIMLSNPDLAPDEHGQGIDEDGGVEGEPAEPAYDPRRASSTNSLSRSGSSSASPVVANPTGAGRERRRGSSTTDYHSLNDDDIQLSSPTASSGSPPPSSHRTISVRSSAPPHRPSDRFLSDQLWSPGQDQPELPAPGIASWHQGGVHRPRHAQQADAEPETLLIVDAPLSSEHPLLVGRELHLNSSASGEEEMIAEEFVAIPKSAYPYLPRHMRRAMTVQSRADARRAGAAENRANSRDRYQARSGRAGSRLPRRSGEDYI